MKFLKYKKLLDKKNIILFDHEYRISYYEIININEYNNNMTGGGNIYNKLKNIDNDTLKSIVKLSISSNPKYIINYI